MKSLSYWAVAERLRWRTRRLLWCLPPQALRSTWMEVGCMRAWKALSRYSSCQSAQRFELSIVGSMTSSFFECCTHGCSNYNRCALMASGPGCMGRWNGGALGSGVYLGRPNGRRASGTTSLIFSMASVIRRSAHADLFQGVHSDLLFGDTNSTSSKIAYEDVLVRAYNPKSPLKGLAKGIRECAAGVQDLF